MKNENPRRIDGQTRVIGLALDDESKAWPLAALEAAGGLIEDTLAGQKLVVLWYPPTQTAAIYALEVDDADPKQTLSIAREGAWQRAAFRDRQTGSRWGVEGRALEGPLQGKTLRWLPGVQCRWFAWAAEYPETELQAGPKDTAAPPASAARGSSSPTDKPVESPLSAVIVSPEGTSFATPSDCLERSGAMTSCDYDSSCGVARRLPGRCYRFRAAANIWKKTARRSSHPVSAAPKPSSKSKVLCVTAKHPATRTGRLCQN